MAAKYLAAIFMLFAYNNNYNLWYSNFGVPFMPLL